MAGERMEGNLSLSAMSVTRCVGNDHTPGNKVSYPDHIYNHVGIKGSFKKKRNVDQFRCGLASQTVGQH